MGAELCGYGREWNVAYASEAEIRSLFDQLGFGPLCAKSQT